METEDYIDNKYIKIKKLGEGSFGKVYLVKSKDTNKEFAVKLLLNECKNFKLKVDLVRFFEFDKKIINNIIYLIIIQLEKFLL